MESDESSADKSAVSAASTKSSSNSLRESDQSLNVASKKQDETATEPLAEDGVLREMTERLVNEVLSRGRAMELSKLQARARTEVEALDKALKQAREEIKPLAGGAGGAEDASAANATASSRLLLPKLKAGGMGYRMWKADHEILCTELSVHMPPLMSDASPQIRSDAQRFQDALRATVGALDVSEKAGRVMQEMLSSEREYFTDLGMLQRLYVKPLTELAKQKNPIITERELGNLFSNFDDIFKLNLDLLRHLEVESKKPPEKMDAGQIFLDFADKFQVYAIYCFPGDHEILTSEGYMGLQQLRSRWKETRGFSNGLKIASFNAVSKTLEYQAASAFVVNAPVFRQNGLVEFRFPSKGISLRVTPEHEMLVQVALGPHARKIIKQQPLVKYDARFLQCLGNLKGVEACARFFLLNGNGSFEDIVIDLHDENVVSLPFGDETWCVQVPNGNIFARAGRGGPAIVVGNCANANAAKKRMEALAQSNKRFSEFCANARSHSAHKGLDIGSFLIKPLQRLCQYPLLLRELLEALPKDQKSTAYVKLQQAFKVMSETVETVNGMLKSIRKRTELQKLTDLISWEGQRFSIIKPGRQFSFCGSFRVRATYPGGEPAKKWKLWEVWLLSDLMILGERNTSKQGDRLIVKCWFPLDNVVVDDGSGTVNAAQWKDASSSRLTTSLTASSGTIGQVGGGGPVAAVAAAGNVAVPGTPTSVRAALAGGSGTPKVSRRGTDLMAKMDDVICIAVSGAQFVFQSEDKKVTALFIKKLQKKISILKTLN